MIGYQICSLHERCKKLRNCCIKKVKAEVNWTSIKGTNFERWRKTEEISWIRLHRKCEKLYRMLPEKQIVGRCRRLGFIFHSDVLVKCSIAWIFCYFKNLEVIFAIARGQYSGLYSKTNRSFSIFFSVIHKKFRSMTVKWPKNKRT